MDTSGDGVVNGLLYAVLLVAALALAPRLPRLPRRRDRPVPAAAVTLWLLVAVPSILGLVFPRVYTALYRDPALILEQGQWWRVVTSVGVQDGGLRGAVFNLVALAVAA
ncbi:MAG: hypothetical protein L0H84_06560, partial [Pseudonocardia sp.]|nr:hypothetical protein [Pseudonocardia sp.]